MRSIGLTTEDLLSEAVRAAGALKPPALVAVDGRCGSGKSLLARRLGERLGCAVFHMDDFFLPPALRTPQRLAAPGGNVHYERVLAELVEPFLAGGPVCFRPFDCRTGGYAAPVEAVGGGLAVLEGSYALHPALRARCALQVFVTCSPACQRRRLLAREGERAPAFFQRWIPLEEAYFRAFRLPEGCDFVLDTTERSLL